jgi:membrane protein YdbS with pleckstrin-like domain
MNNTNFFFRRHPIVLSKAILILIIGIASVYIGQKYNYNIKIYLPIAIILIFICFYRISGWWFSIVNVTDQSLNIITQKGLLQRSEISIPYKNINNLSYASKGFLQAIIGYGSIIIQTQVGDVSIDKVSSPQTKYNDILKIYLSKGHNNNL